MQITRDEQRPAEGSPKPPQEQKPNRSGEGLDSIVSRLREEEAKKVSGRPAPE